MKFFIRLLTNGKVFVRMLETKDTVVIDLDELPDYMRMMSESEDEPKEN